MKIVVIGGSGLIGSQVVKQLREQGHEALAASPRHGVNAVTGEGLAEALAGAQVIVDVSNSPSFEDGPVLEFFDKSTRNLAAAGAAAGVRHFVILSVVGTDRMQAAGYFRAKLVQENLVRASGLPYTILRATQFFEFLEAIAHVSTRGNEVRLSSGALQPVAALDVSSAVAQAALDEPLNAIIEVAGPERRPLDEFVRTVLTFKGDPREVIADDAAGYFGTPIDDRSLTPDEGAIIGQTRLEDWLKARRE
jgi:uncharacterized protein YbjT (DUF2867 family)